MVLMSPIPKMKQNRNSGRTVLIVLNCHLSYTLDFLATLGSNFHQVLQFFCASLCRAWDGRQQTTAN